MSTPEIETVIGGYRLKWAEEQIRASVSGVNFHSNGAIKAEVLIETFREDYNPHIHRAQFNFEATRSRKDLAQACYEAHKELTMDQWKTVIESLTVRTLDKIREGEPVVELHGRGEVAPPRYLLEPFILEACINTIFAERSSSKSLLALLLSLLMTVEDRPSVLGLTRVPDSQRILYLDWEDSAVLLDYQLACLMRGLKLTGIPPIFYRHCSLPLADDIVQIQRKCVETRANIVIIDSLGMAVGDDLNATKPAFAFFAALRQLKLTSLLLGHTSKDKEGKIKTVYGNGYYENEPRNIWEANKEQEPGSPALDLSMYHRKSPPFGGLREPLGFHFSFAGNTTSVTAEDPKVDRRDNTARASAWDLIVNQLEGCGNLSLSPSELAKRTGQKLNTIAHTLQRKLKTGEIAEENGRYALPG